VPAPWRSLTDQRLAESLGFRYASPRAVIGRSPDPCGRRRVGVLVVPSNSMMTPSGALHRDHLPHDRVPLAVPVPHGRLSHRRTRQAGPDLGPLTARRVDKCEARFQCKPFECKQSAPLPSDQSATTILRMLCSDARSLRSSAGCGPWQTRRHRRSSAEDWRVVRHRIGWPLRGGFLHCRETMRRVRRLSFRRIVSFDRCDALEV
jgi:hypothetical protein